MRLGTSAEMSDVIEKPVMPEGLNEHSTDIKMDLIIKKTAETAHHMSCTCRMGLAEKHHAGAQEDGARSGARRARVGQVSTGVLGRGGAPWRPGRGGWNRPAR